MQTITTFDNTAEGWERSLYAFLAEKERRSGSRRTVEGYSRMLQHFFGTVGKPPDRVTSAGGLRLGLRRRALRQAAVVRHDRRPARLPQQLLPLPDPHGHRLVQPLRRARTAAGPGRHAARPDRRRHPQAARRDPGDAGRPARPRDHPDADAHRPAPRRGAEHGRRRPHARGRRDLVPLPRQGRTSRASGSCRSPRTWRSRRRCRPSGGTSRPWRRMRRCGRPARATAE